MNILYVDMTTLSCKKQLKKVKNVYYYVLIAIKNCMIICGQQMN